MDIHKGLGNANKLMNRILQATCDVFHLSEVGYMGEASEMLFQGRAWFWGCRQSRKGAFKRAFETIRQAILDEYKILEPELDISYSEGGIPAKVMDAEAQKYFCRRFYAAHNGVYRMSPAIEGLVEASNNIAKVLVLDGTIKIDCLTRSSVESSKWMLHFR